MFEAAIASLAGVIGIIAWWTKNRAKTRKERDDEEIAYKRRLRDTEVDSWIHRR
jgi:hypothetical protein